MNKLVIGGIVGVIVIGAIAVLILNYADSTPEVPATDTQEAVVTRPAVKAVPNTFSVMTPEERAAADEAARLQAETDALASTTASTTATSADGSADEEEAEQDNEE